MIDLQVTVHIISHMKQFTQDINKFEHHLVTLDNKTITIDWHGRDNQMRHASMTIDKQGYKTQELADRAFRRLQVCNGLERKLRKLTLDNRK